MLPSAVPAVASTAPSVAVPLVFWQPDESLLRPLILPPVLPLIAPRFWAATSTAVAHEAGAGQMLNGRLRFGSAIEQAHHGLYHGID